MKKTPNDIICEIYGWSSLKNRYKNLDELIDIKPGDVILDCGAHHGDTSIYFSYKTGLSGKVYGIEVDEDNFIKFIEFIQKFHRSNIVPILMGVSNRRGVTNLYWSEWDSTYTLFRRSKKAHLDKFKRVMVDSLDNIIKDWGIKKIDLIYMNMEGAEYLALKGMNYILTELRPKICISEHDKYLPQSFVKQHDLKKSLEKYNYKIVSEKPLVAEPK